MSGFPPGVSGQAVDAMLLDLNKLHGPREHVERTLPPSVFDPPDPDYRVAAPVELSMDVAKAGRRRVRGHGTCAATRLELACGRCLEPFEMPVEAAFELRYVPQSRRTPARRRAGDRRRRPRDRVLPRRDAGRRRPAARAVSARAADEAAVQRGVPRPVPAVRHEPESDRLRVQRRSGKIPAGAAQGPVERDRRRIEMPNPKRRHSKTRTAKRRTHDALKPVPVGTCPQCQEAKAPHQVCPHCGYYGAARCARSKRHRLVRTPSIRSTDRAGPRVPARSRPSRGGRHRSAGRFASTSESAHRHRRDGRRPRARAHRRRRAGGGAPPADRAAAGRRRAATSSASWRGIPARDALDIEILHAPERDRDGGAGRGGAAAEAAARRSGWRPKRCATAGPRRCSAPATPARR